MIARSPIEMMIDVACDFDPNMPRPEPRKTKATDVDAQALMNVGDAAVAWLEARESGLAEIDATRVLVEAAKVLAKTGW